MDNDEKGTCIVRTLGGNQEMLCVNESGLYSLVLTSRKPQAKRFKKWLTSITLILPKTKKSISLVFSSKIECNSENSYL
ncbi:Bro-N domain-containing protein [Nostoc sp. 2RC]|uniref:BRO-N domain-containing protein n=1 Tax=Nostoc sp. 2RC TaxID=2485484 RepID=UPI001C89A3C6